MVPKSDGLLERGSSIQFPIKDVTPQCAFMQADQLQVEDGICNSSIGIHEAKALLEFKNKQHEAKEEAAMMKEDVTSSEWNTSLNERERLLTPLQRLCNRDQMDLCAAFLTHRCNEQSKFTSAKTITSMPFFKDSKHYQLQPPDHLLYFPFPSSPEDVKPHDHQQQRMLVNYPSITSNVLQCQLSSSQMAAPETEGGQSDLDSDDGDISNKPLTTALLLHLGPLNKLKELDLSIEDLTDVSLLNEIGASSLLSLSLNVNRLRTLQGVGSLTGLRRLHACDNCLSNLRGLEHLSRLQDLNVDVNQIKSLNGLGELFCLTDLSVATNKIFALPDHPLTLCNLQKLNLFHNRVASIPQRSLSQLRHLTDLDIGRNILTKISGEVFDGCVALTRLVLSHNRLKTPPNNMRLPLLKELWLNGNSMSSLQDWTGTWLPSLQELRLGDNCLTSLGNRLLSPRLYSSGYVDGGCLDFGGLNGMPLLQILNVSFNTLENDNSLDGLYCCKRLQELHIHDNPISNVDSPLRRTMFRQVLDFCPSLQVLNGERIVEGEVWLSDACKIARKSDIIIPPLFRLMNSAGVTVRECRGSEADSLLTALASRDTSKTLTCKSCGKTSQGLLPEEGVIWDWAPSGQITKVSIRESRKKRLIVNCEACGTKGYTIYRPFVFDWNAMARWSKAYHFQNKSFHSSLNEFDTTAGHKLCGHYGEDFLFNAWFEGNLNWGAMRGRHRREERALVANAWGKGMGGGDQDLCIRRLDLMDQHTREINEYTKQQLCKLFLLGPRSEEAALRRQVDRHFPVSEKAVAVCTSSPRTYEANACTNIKCSSKIVYHLCVRMSEGSCALHVEEGGDNNITTNTSESNTEKLVAARIVQSVFRGFRTRRSLNAALSSARYLDDEVQKIQDFGPIDVDAILGPLQPNLKVTYDRRSRIASKLNKYLQTMGKTNVLDQNIGTSHRTTMIETSTSILGCNEANVTSPPIQSLTVTRQENEGKVHSAAVAVEWGLTNPNTIRNMLARRRRLQMVTRQDKQKNRISLQRQSKYWQHTKLIG